MHYFCKQCKKEFKGDICPYCRRSVKYSPESMFTKILTTSQ